MAYTTIDKPSDYFNTKLYTGNGGTQSITGLDFAPNWVWIKDRGDTGWHQLVDTVRGATKYLSSNATNAEGTEAAGLTSFNSDGFSLGNNTNYNSGDPRTYVSWNWKAGTSFTNDASSTGIGSIDSAGSVNTDAGFSIISWTGDGNNGATIAHGLGVTPAIVITKRRDDTGDWLVGGSTINTARGGANSLLLLNTNAAMDSNSEVYQTFSSTTFQVGVNAYANTSGSTMISYCFAEKQGYSKFGSFTSNTSTNDSFIYLGFKPNFFLVKSTTNTNAWIMFDGARNKSNPTNAKLYPNSSEAEDTEPDFDFLSNGVKLRANFGNNTFIYMAFAENPFVTSTGVPATAR